MSTTLLYGTIGVWIGIVAVVAVVGAQTGAHLTVTTSTLLLVLGSVPPAVVLRIFGSAEPQTASQLLRQ
jgi:hypothetical protein